MKRHYFYTLFAFLLFGMAAGAQQKGEAKLDLQYSVALPMGSFKDVIHDNSPRGIQASILFGINSQLSVGLGTGYQDFYQKYPRQMYKLENGSDLSAVRSFSIQTVPILALAKWRFAPNAAIQPYATLGIGGNLVNYNDYVGEFSLEQKTKFGFAARPGAGVYVPFRKGGESGFTLGASYNIMPLATDALTNLNNLSLHAGISVPLRK